MKGLTRDLLIRTGLRLLDEVGLDGLTVRKLAAEVGVQSPALYWHFRTKQELLDGMANEIILRAGMGPPADGEGWQEWLRRRARAYRKSLLASRDGARVVSSAVRAGNAVQHLEVELEAMVARGFSPLLALRTIMTLGHYIDGHVLQEQTTAARPRPSGISDISQMPTIFAAVTAGSPQGDEVFEHGLDVLIAGTEAVLTRPGTP